MRVLSFHRGCKEETFGYHEVELRGWYGKVFCGRRQKGWNHRVAGVSLDHDKDGSKAPSLRCVELESKRACSYMKGAIWVRVFNHSHNPRRQPAHTYAHTRTHTHARISRIDKKSMCAHTYTHRDTRNTCAHAQKKLESCTRWNNSRA